MKDVNKVAYYVVKVGDEYFEDAWEDIYLKDDEVNYSFADKIENAYPFHGLDEKWSAPKYLWNDRENKNINTTREACEYFNGEILLVTKTVTTTYETEKVSIK